MIDSRFTWVTADELDLEESDLDEGRHSAPWHEQDHPRGFHGRFGDGGGHDSGGDSSAGGAGHPTAPSSSPGTSPANTGNAAAHNGGGQPRGMPDTLASSTVTLAGGAGTITIDRHADDTISIGDGNHIALLSKDQATRLISRLSFADDWNPGDDEHLDGIGHIAKTGRNQYQADITGGPTLTLTQRDITRMEQSLQRVDLATRVDTGNGDTDVFADGKKIGFRHVGDDGRPVEAVFNRGSFDKISSAIDAIIDELDSPDVPGKPVTAKTVSTNLGRVQVEIRGRWNGGNPSADRLEITPVDGGWGIVVDGPNQQAFGDAMGRFEEAQEQPMHDQILSEQVTLAEAAAGAPGRRFRARLIRGDVQGSSGFYPAAMLRENAAVFREGLPVFLDHPGVSEAFERPERSVRDLAGRLASAAVYKGDGLYADVEVYPHMAPVIEAMAGDIGMSIRASGTVEQSTNESIRGPIVTSLSEASSVDFVTAAGAGGKIVALLESAREQAGEYLRRAAEHVDLAEAGVSDTAWNPSTADYDIAQWRKACLIGPSQPSEAKGDYSLPVREPDGTLNRAGVHAAASRISQVKAAPDVKTTAAKKLVGLYGQLKEDPPASLLKLAGDSTDTKGGGKPKPGGGNLAPPFTKAKESALSESGTVGAWLESRLHLVLTTLADDMYGCGQLTRDERIALSAAVGGALDTFTASVQKDAPALYQRGQYEEPDQPDDASADPAQAGQAAMAETRNVPAPPAEPKGAPVSGSTDKQGTPESGGAQTEVAESAREKALAAQLAEAKQAQAQTGDRLAALEKRLTESDAKTLRLENDQAARAACAEALKTSGLLPISHTRVTESVCRDLPTVEGGGLDVAKLGEAITNAITAEGAYLASFAEAAGVGQVRGLGESTSTVLSEADIDKQLAEAFEDLGLDEKAALAAVHGRA